MNNKYDGRCGRAAAKALKFIDKGLPRTEWPISDGTMHEMVTAIIVEETDAPLLLQQRDQLLAVLEECLRHGLDEGPPAPDHGYHTTGGAPTKRERQADKIEAKARAAIAAVKEFDNG